MDLRNVFATNLRRLRHAKELSQGDLAYEASCIYLAQLKKRGVLRGLKIVDNLGIEPAELLMATRKPQHSAPSARAVTRNMRLVSAASRRLPFGAGGATVYTEAFGELLHRQRS